MLFSNNIFTKKCSAERAFYQIDLYKQHFLLKMLWQESIFSLPYLFECSTLVISLSVIRVKAPSVVTLQAVPKPS